MNWIIVIIIVMSCLDIFFTWNYISTFHKMYPKSDYRILEANPILRGCWERWGIDKGTIIGGLIILALILIMVLFLLKINWQYYLAGTLSMMLIYHYLNWQQLLFLVKQAAGTG